MNLPGGFFSEALMTATSLYADGGVILKNPSKIGGTFAWCHVNAASERIHHGSGILTPAELQLPEVTNNHTELLAVIRGLQSLPDGWTGTVFTDSQVTIQRVFGYGKLKNVPRWMIDEMKAERQRLDHLRGIKPVLLDGHPTRKHLETGVGKRGNLVSVHNVWCDQECTRLAADFAARKAG